VNLSEYGTAVIAGTRSMISAARGWRSNTLTARVNRQLWGPGWVAVLAGLVVAFIAVDVVLPPFSLLIGLAPPLTGFAFFPGLIRDLFYSAPAFFAFVVAWRVRSLRASDSSDWSDRAAIEGFGGRFFDAGALPIAVAAISLGIGIELVSSVGLSHPFVHTGTGDLEPWTVGGASLRLARTLVIIALASGILTVHRTIRAGVGKLFGAGFFVWGVHLGIGFAVPWMTSWLAYLPIIGPHVPDSSAGWAHFLFDVAVASAAWTAAREKCRATPLWADAAPPPPPPPPPPSDT
jgi:hypothetical protein